VQAVEANTIPVGTAPVPLNKWGKFKRPALSGPEIALLFFGNLKKSLNYWICPANRIPLEMAL
jgi:hypothetical protein